MTPPPPHGADPSLETRTLKGHTWKTDESPAGSSQDLQINALGQRSQRSPTEHSRAFHHPFPPGGFSRPLSLLSSNGPSLARATYFLSLFLLRLASSTSVTFQINFSLYLSLGSEFFLSQNSSAEVAALRSGLTPPVQHAVPSCHQLNHTTWDLL